ncbi:MAG: hypothetical protein AABX70_01105 [Nanoarchaeota archaeon]
MPKQIVKIYFSGKIHPTPLWREDVCKTLESKSGCKILALDPTKFEPGFDLNHQNAMLLVGRNSYMIQQADFVFVNLTDDISVGGSQEMLIAKHFGIPLIGLAPKEGKFNKSKEVVVGRMYTDFIHPYVKLSCDAIAETVEEVAEFIVSYLKEPKPSKNMGIIDQALVYYQKQHCANDLYLNQKFKT